MLQEEKVYYTYAYLDPRKPGIFIYGDYKFDFEPFYIGKGKGSRINAHINSVMNNWDSMQKESHLERVKIIKEILFENKKPIIVKIKYNLSESEAFLLEEEIIKIIGRKCNNNGPLLNIVEGGLPKITKESRERLTKARWHKPNRFIWDIIDKNGKIYTTDNLPEFCEYHKLTYSHVIISTLKNKKPYGWSFKKRTENNINSDKYMNIKIKKGEIELNYKYFLFPAGEVGIKLDVQNYKFFNPLIDSTDYIEIFARINNSNDFLVLAMLKDALEQRKCIVNKLILPYVPYSRQDRTCDAGESFSLKVFANLLNALNFKEVVIVDPHSNACELVINHAKAITQFDIVQKWDKLANRLNSCILVSPDAGANKKTAQIAGYLNHREFIRADKLRDLSNGNIKETIVYCDDLKGRDVAIIDDLCEKGGTFIALAKVLKQKNAGKIILYVTHGIFSGDLKNLYDNGISEIYTTDSYREDLVETENFHIYNLEKNLS